MKYTSFFTKSSLMFLILFSLNKYSYSQINYSPNFGAMSKALRSANNRYESGLEELKLYLDKKRDRLVLNKYNKERQELYNHKIKLTYDSWVNLDFRNLSNVNYAKKIIDKVYNDYYIDLEGEIFILIINEMRFRNCLDNENNDVRCNELANCLDYLENCDLTELTNMKDKFKLSNKYEILLKYK